MQRGWNVFEFLPGHIIGRHDRANFRGPIHYYGISNAVAERGFKVVAAVRSLIYFGYCLGAGSLVQHLRTVTQDRHNRKPGLALITIWFFVLLLVSSAPHRVHHLFEELPLSTKSSDDAAR